MKLSVWLKSLLSSATKFSKATHGITQMGIIIIFFWKADGHYYCDRNLNLLFKVSPSRIVETYLHGSDNIIIKMWPSYMESKMMVECPCGVIWVPCIASIVIRWSRGKLFEVDKFLLFWNIKGIDWFAGKKLQSLSEISVLILQQLPFGLMPKSLSSWTWRLQFEFYCISK